METTELHDTVQAFSTFLLSKGRKPSTIKRYVYDIEDFGHWLKKNKRLPSSNIWSTLCTKDYEDYFYDLKMKRHYSEKTMHRVFIVLNRLYQFLNLPNPLKNMEIVIQPNRALRDEDFISPEEEQRLKRIVTSLEGLSEKQQSVRPLLIDRNISILILLIDYGLSLQELVSLNMHHIHFETNSISVPAVSGVERTIILTTDDKKQLYTYYKNIPEPVRPNYHSDDPFFIAFDFNRGTYRWVYENDAPKALTEIAIQKMIRLEVKRANLRKGISSQHFRNTFILRLIKQQIPEQEIIKLVGFKSKISLKRYYLYATQTENA
ncbi:tyrosine-type recombinase/integrase [Bacillus cytotoxicus]|uniref:Phage integrase domain protein SAM domain protein n=1 Tax=Bacillus cytotoxicus (strain DSM 22905 / CIP 110041 / 391-98 / NVH 391-98) TaxID=315749 RepID=A7GR68_BACCN|nr:MULTISPECIES: site-specific integrase [Bacillus cereus group]ABS22626.1 phage integrase domain protein SAM domain protein [Bacillus cytotoxicus NVH 391-98]AWC29296.1 integrase [Bacillus cytotoxicus]AWC41422.1 integrase [Bacillus cytotoxicus]AWC45269.1 integrase [Bacillus cytotoxicus]AWC49353.1 integrase [Bacillus cytotoxicus]